MDALKRKAKETQEDIKRAENKYKDLIRLLRQAEERASLADDEVAVLKQRIQNKKEELANSYRQLKEKQQGHQATEEIAEESEKIRKSLESKEFEVSDVLVMLEIKVRDKKRQADEAEERLAEAKVRYSCMKSELSELLARLNTAESKIVKLSEESDSTTVRLINLESKHRRYSKREEYFEDKVETTEQQIRNLETEAIANEAEIKILVVQRDRLKQQVNSWKKRVANLSRELEDVKADLNY
ncbi:tropomyosin beta chain [Pocillopora verrucosa]|uniref:tropomyosin beta chain n=1 Tax=Pocillopora verrucosa TaxID=203993 RepID=UPI002797277E|nr:tropomyosin A-like [Pocillopora verrucosa]